ncbi:hypothetical protein NKG94_30965 [Micromonospora sp. M12]
MLWRMHYETCARAEEILGLDVPDLDMEFRRALITEKGGDRAYVHWETQTARLLPRLLAGRTAGPVFSPNGAHRRRAPHTSPERRSPRHRPQPAVLPARRIPVQTGIQTPRPTRRWIHPAPTAPQRTDPPRRQGPQRRRSAGQVPPPAPRHPRHLRPARRRDLRPHHRRQRRPPPPAPALTLRPTYQDHGTQWQSQRSNGQPQTLTTTPLDSRGDGPVCQPVPHLPHVRCLRRQGELRRRTRE